MMTRKMFSMSLALAALGAALIAWLMIQMTDQILSSDAKVEMPERKSSVQRSLSPDFTPTEPQPYAPNSLNSLTPEVGRQLKLVLTAIQNNDFDAARRLISEASAGAKTSFDRYKIGEVNAYLYGAERNYKGLLSVYMEWLEKPELRTYLKPEFSADLIKHAAIAASAAREHAHAIQLGIQWLQVHRDDLQIVHLVGQSYYLTHNFQACRDFNWDAIERLEQEVGRPTENMLQLLRYCADKVGDAQGATLALSLLCRYYGNPTYWDSYISTHSRNSTDFAQNYWDRLRWETAGFDDSADLMLFAQYLSVDQYLHATAFSVLEQMRLSGTFADDPVRRGRLEAAVAQARQRAQSDRERIPTLQSQVQADTTGESQFELGRIYFDNNQYEQAIVFFTLALEKTQFKSVSTARMLIGLAYLAAGDHAKARSTFELAASDEQLSAVAQAWILHSYNS